MKYKKLNDYIKHTFAKVCVVSLYSIYLLTVSCNKAEDTTQNKVDSISQIGSILGNAGYQEISIKFLPTGNVDFSYSVQIKNDSLYVEQQEQFIKDHYKTALDNEEQKWIKYLVENLETDVIEESKFYKDSWVVTVAVNDKIVYRQNISQRYYSQPRRVSELLYTISALSVIEFDLFDYN